MKMTLNTIGGVETIIDCIEGNKKNAVINSILMKAFTSGFAYESLLEHISYREIQKIKLRVNKMKVNTLLTDEKYKKGDMIPKLNKDKKEVLRYVEEEIELEELKEEKVSIQERKDELRSLNNSKIDSFDL